MRLRKTSRQQFLKQLSLLSASAFFFPKEVLADSGIQVKDFSIIDLHCHPSLKMYLWGCDMRHRHFPGKGDNTIVQQIDIRTLRSGYIRGLMATHYLVEASAEAQWTKLEIIIEFIKTHLPKLQDRFEHEDFSNFTQINIMIDTLETQLHLANQHLGIETFVVARSYKEFKRAIEEGKIPFAHAIEGAHALGRHNPLGLRKHTGYQPIAGKMRSREDDANKYIRNLEALKARGVCMITLAHLFQNDIASPCEGIAVNEKKSLGMNWFFDPQINNYPLSPIGRQVVEKMLDIGMIVDLTHSTPAVRQDVFEINRKRGDKKRPLTFTHTGSRDMFNRYDQQYNKGANINYGYYGVSREEIQEICNTGGVIGVVFENFWLTGCDTHLGADQKQKFRDCVPYIVETIVELDGHTPSGKFTNIAIGSDFDGLADAGKDMYVPSQISTLIDAMKNPAKYGVPPDRQHVFTDQEIRLIFHENAARLLETGWTEETGNFS